MAMGIYERFFALYDEPFRLTPDPRYLFLSEKHREVLAHLRLGTSESGGFVCITGDVGTGKTTIIRSFLDQLEAGTPYAYIFNPPQSPLELVQTINAELGLPSAQPSRKAAVDALNTFLLEQRRARGRTLVVVDEAQALPPEVLEELRLLSNLETTTAKLLQIALFGQPQLADVLCSADLAQLNQRITFRWHLGPLSRRETAEYVRHRLRVAAGGVERTIFNKRALARIHAYSGGVPRLINILCHRSLLASYAAERRRVTLKTVERVHDEIQRVPLLGTTHRTAARVRNAAWAVGGAALAAALGWALVFTDRVPLEIRLSPRGFDAPQDAAPGVTLPEEPIQPEGADRGGRLAMMTAETPKPISTLPADSAGEVHPQTSGTGMPSDKPSPHGARLSAPEAAHMLAASTEVASTTAAIEAILKRWYERPLVPDETIVPMHLDAIAERRDLNYLPITGSVSMLRVLNLPVILELVIPAAAGPRYAVLAGVEVDACLLVLDGNPTKVERSFLDEYWLGQAHMVWRDFEDLAPSLGEGSTGPRVHRLQQMLAQLALYTGPTTGIFDNDTQMAVVAFQRSRQLFADGVVGRLTRIALYDALGNYAHPRLVVKDPKADEADT